jgi:hypothetical protein
MEYVSFYKKDGRGLLDNHKPGKLAKSFIVQIDDGRSFVLLDGIDSFMEYRSSAKVEMFHEVILRDSSRKFFVDLDYKTTFSDIAEYRDVAERFANHVKIIKGIIINLFNITYTPKYIGEDDILEVVSNADLDQYLAGEVAKYKFSMNLIIDKFRFPNYGEFASFGKLLIDTYESRLTGKSIIDGQFFSESDREFIQNRMVFSTKKGELRYKYPLINGEVSRDQSLYRNYVLQSSLSSKGEALIIEKRLFSNWSGHSSSVDISDEDTTAILDATRQYWEGFTYRDRRNGFITFDKIVDGVFCVFCKEVHHKDNFLYFTIDGDGNVFRKCYQRKGEREWIWRLPSEEPAKPIIVDVDEKSLYWAKPLLKIGAKMTVVSEPVISNAFTDDDLMLIKAEMKMGKSKALLEFLRARPNSKVLFVSFRRTFSAEARSKYSEIGFKSYCDSDVASEIDMSVNRKIIVQVESLHRLKLPKDLDFVIMDEVESIWSQFSSNNFRDFYGSFNAFHYALQSAKQVIAMDANLSVRSARLFADQFKNKSVNIYINKHNPDAYKIKYFVIEKESWLASLVRVIREDSRVAIFTNSLKEANTLKSFLLNYLAKSDIKLYSSKTRESVKSRHFGNVNNHWSRYKCIICTPTISAGVSFEREHFHYVFGYFSDMSCNVETCRQMLGRVRNVINGEVYISMAAAGGTYLTDIRKIRETLTINRQELVRGSTSLGLINFSIDRATGESLYEDSFALRIILENMAFDNKSRNGFIGRMERQLSGEYNGLHVKCEIIDKVSGLTFNEKAKVYSLYKDVKLVVKNIELENVVNAEDLTPDKYAELIEKSRNLCDITMQEHHAREKYKITNILRIEPAIIDKLIVEQFKDKNKLRAFTRNVHLFAGGSWNSSIADIHVKDRHLHDDVNNRSKDTIMFNGVIHEMFKQLCELVGLDVLRIVTVGDHIQPIAVRSAGEKIKELMTNLAPMVDFSLRTDLGITADCESISKLLHKFYAFRQSKEKLFGMENVVYEHNGELYMNGKRQSSPPAKPLIRVNYV